MLSAVVGALLCPAALRAQHAEQHFTAYPAHDLYRRSAFVHGYMHGYEEGFHEADFDVHLGRAPRPIEDFKAFRKADAGYERSFGSKAKFQFGYREGFREGYADSAVGRSFRAVSETDAAAAGLHGSAPDDNFDDGVMAGYQAARAGAPKAPSMLNAADCNLAAHAPNYCDGYTRGFRLGQADAAAHQAHTGTQTAQKK